MTPRAQRDGFDEWMAEQGEPATELVDGAEAVVASFEAGSRWTVTADHATLSGYELDPEATSTRQLMVVIDLVPGEMIECLGVSMSHGFPMVKWADPRIDGRGRELSFEPYVGDALSARVPAPGSVEQETPAMIEAENRRIARAERLMGATRNGGTR